MIILIKKRDLDVLDEVKPKQLLHIPYARTVVPEGEEDVWGEGWVAKDLKLDGIELLDARNESDLAKANNPILRYEMKEVNAEYGIGIDSISGIIIDTETYPSKYRTVGNGLVEFVKREKLLK